VPDPIRPLDRAMLQRARADLCARRAAPPSTKAHRKAWREREHARVSAARWIAVCDAARLLAFDAVCERLHLDSAQTRRKMIAALTPEQREWLAAAVKEAHVADDDV